ncbi:hypothetical protein SO694_00011124 [Aureococcus anophagefferens]|uniref:Uncharacterized protein n=1 Tax=Aureococcus anophagefferens TaxID=44056 RepID=A0ABR1GEG7_AURAN
MGPVRQSALMRPSMIKPEVNSTKMNHEVIDTQNTEQDHRKFLETGDDALSSPSIAMLQSAVPPAAFNMEEALCSVEEDLQRDLGDREQMSFHEFSESLFEIVDMWTLTRREGRVPHLLRNLYLRISEPSITGSRQFRRVDAVVSVETPDLTAILKEGEVLKADRELGDTEIQQMNDDFESSRQSDIELGIAPRGSGLEAQASEEAARPSRRTVAPGGGRRRDVRRAAVAQAQRRSSVAATREMARARKRSRQVTLVEPSHSSDEDETDDDVGASEPIWRAPGRRNDSHEGEYDGYDGDGRAPKKKKDGTNMWLVGGVMRTRNTGVLRYLGPSDGHTLPQDALSRGVRRSARTTARAAALGPALVRTAAGRPSDGVAEAVGKGGRRKKEKAIPRTAAWLFHMDQASWGGDASSLDAGLARRIRVRRIAGSHYVMVAAERATSAADGLFHIGVPATPRRLLDEERRPLPKLAPGRVPGGKRASWAAYAPPAERAVVACRRAAARGAPPPRPPAPPGEAPAPEAPERPETEPEAAAPAPAAPPVKVELVPGDPGSLTLSPSAAGSLNLSPSPPNSPRKRAPNRAVRVVEVGADPRGAASRHY